MDLELLNFVTVDMKWNIMKKGRSCISRRPRKPGANSFDLGNKIQEPVAFERKKSGTDVAEKLVDAPLKKRRLLHQSTSPSPPPQTLFIKDEEGLSPGPQTPAVHHEDSGQRCRSNSLSHSQKTKSKTGLRNSKILKPIKREALKLDDFSGIELLAAAACSSFIHDNLDHVDDFSMSKEHTKPEVNSCIVDIKDAESNDSSIQQNLHDNGKEVEEKKVVPSKGLRLHWDLNTVMDEWEKPCDDLLIENQLSVKHDFAAISVENCNGGSFEETHELIQDLNTKTINIKSSDGECSASKSDVVDSLTNPAKCEDFSTSTTSVLKEQTVVNCESDTIDNPELVQQPVFEEVIQGFCDKKVTTEDPVSECCGSNVTQEEQGHMAEGDSEDKLQVGYDSPFEDGELREPTDKTEKETLYYESDNIFKDDFGTIENPLSDKVDHGQIVDDQSSLLVKKPIPNNGIEQGPQADISERKDVHDDESRPAGENLLHNDESTSFGEYVHRSRSGNIVDSSMRVWDLKSHRSLDSNYSRNYNNSRGGGYRTQDRRSSPSERNNGSYYGSYRGQLPARSHSRDDRYRFYSQEYHDPKPCYLERKPRFSPNFNRHDTRSRSKSRSRSGSPITWHFQKRKNLDTSNSGEVETITRGGHVSPERSSKCLDDRRFKDGQRSQRFESIGYPERLKSDDYFRFGQRPARCSHMTGPGRDHKYRDNGDVIRKHDGYYEKVNRAGRPDDDGGVRRFRYEHARE